MAVGLIALFPALTGCETSSGGSKKAQAEISNITKFSSAEYGVEASPRVTATAALRGERPVANALGAS